MPWRDLTKLYRDTFAPGAVKGTVRVAYARVAPMVILAAVIFVADTVTRNHLSRNKWRRKRATWLVDARTGKNGRHALVGLLRQSVFGRLAGL
jgi:hypothetical protein